MKRVAATVAGVALVGALTVGCDPGPECKNGHSVMTMMPVFNGKTTTYQPMWTFVCDEYEKESAQ